MYAIGSPSPQECPGIRCSQVALEVHAEGYKELGRACTGRQQCRHLADRATLTNCAAVSYSNYLMVTYACIPGK